MIKRRIITAVLLLAVAVGSPLYWNDGGWSWTAFGINLMFAALGFLFLHHRWKRIEDRTVSPDKAKDIFS